MIRLQPAPTPPYSICDSGRYFTLRGGTDSQDNFSNGRLAAGAFFFSRPITIDRLGLKCTVLGGAGALFRLGIWTPAAGGSIPVNLLLDAGTIDGTSATVQEITVSQAIPAGWVWFGAAVQGAPTPVPYCETRTTTGGLGDAMSGATNTEITSTNGAGFKVEGITGAFGATFGTPVSYNHAPKVFFRVV